MARKMGLGLIQLNLSLLVSTFTACQSGFKFDLLRGQNCLPNAGSFPSGRPLLADSVEKVVLPKVPKILKVAGAVFV
jgi:hypothetical protein